MMQPAELSDAAQGRGKRVPLLPAVERSLAEVCRSLGRALGAKGVLLYTVERSGPTVVVHPVVWWGETAPLPADGFPRPWSESIWRGAPIVVPNARVGERALRDALDRLNGEAALLLPFPEEESPLGCLVALWDRPIDLADCQLAAARTHGRWATSLLLVARHAVALPSELQDLLLLTHHELRTPLANLRLYSQLLDRALSQLVARPDQENRTVGRPLAYLRVLDSQVGRLTHLVDSLTDMASVLAGTFAVQRTPTDLAVEIPAVVRDLRRTVPAHQLVYEGPGSPVHGRVDTRRLRIALAHLVWSAARHSPMGSRIVVGLESSAERARLRIADEGPDIEARGLAHVLFPLSREVHRRVEHQGGTGLGLALVVEILQAHGGRVWAEGAPGRRSCVVMELPLDLAT